MIAMVMMPPALPSVLEKITCGRPAHDVRKDDQRHAIADTALGDELTNPHDQHGARGERTDDHEVEDDTGSAGAIKADAEALKEEEVTHGVEDCQSQGEVTRILRNLGLTDLALAGKPCREGTTAWSIWRMIELVM